MLIIDADYLITCMTKLPSNSCSFSTKAHVDRFIEILYTNLISKEQGHFTYTHLIYSLPENNPYMRPPIDSTLWQNFTIHTNLINQTDTCKSCNKYKGFDIDKSLITAQTTVSLVESIILKFNKKISGIKDSILVLLAPRQSYEVIIELAKKYVESVLIIGSNERINAVGEKYFELKDILKAGIRNKPIPISDNLQESSKIQDDIAFPTLNDPNEANCHYVIGLKFVPVAVTKESLQEMLEQNGCKPVYSTLTKDKRGTGNFVKLFFNSIEPAHKAKEFVYLYIT